MLNDTKISFFHEFAIGDRFESDVGFDVGFGQIAVEVLMLEFTGFVFRIDSICETFHVVRWLFA